MKLNFLILIAILVLLISCTFFEDKKDRNQILAKVDNFYLEKKDIEELPLQIMSDRDSIAFIKDYINKWAINKIMKEKASSNLDNKDMADIDKMVEKYKEDLIINKYKEFLNSKFRKEYDQKDKERESIFLNYYESHKEIFRLDQTILKLNYILVPEKINNINHLVNLMRTDLTEEVIYEIESICYGVTETYSLKDSTWIGMNIIRKKIPLNDKDIVKGKVFKIMEGKFVWIVKINEYIKVGEIAPFDYIKSGIKNIIFNQGKLEFIKEIEKDLLEKYTKNGRFEIYNY